MKQCVKCGSFAINHNCHGRDGSDGDLCDVCYWRKRAGGQEDARDAARWRWLRDIGEGVRGSVVMARIKEKGGELALTCEVADYDAEADAALQAEQGGEHG